MAASGLSAHALRRADGPAGHQQAVAIGGQVDTLAKQVKAIVTQESYLKVFSIVGFGGVGKTTLAMEVFRRLEADFQRRAMVSVSQAFEAGRDLKALLKRVLQQVVKEKTDNERGIKEEGNLGEIDSWDNNKLADKLEELLNDKRYLIVIDDVWTIRAWEAIVSVLPENNCHSRVIVTTRIETVAKACSPASVNGHYIHEMQPLKLEDSKKLFLSRAFGSMDADYPKELEDVMGGILKKCGGLPLAIVSIASVLAGYRSSGSKEKWETVCKSIGSQMEINPTLEGMKNIVTLSYNHLPYELKSCMMYLSIFPEDYEINKDRLLGRWIAEGLVPEKRGLTLMEVAESYLDELVSRNMIEPRFGFDGKVESCQVHDMLLEVMVSKSLECNYISLIGGQYAGMSYDRIRRLSIHGDDRRPLDTKQPKKKKVGHGIEGMDLDHVRSLSLFQLLGHKLLDHLDKFTLLRILDLEDCEGLTNHHMRNICRLYLLKFLSLKGTGIREVPPEIGKLEHLQTLDTRGTFVQDLPETVTNLEKLERIEFSHRTEWYYLWCLPKGLKKMKALREVHIAILKNKGQIARELGELQQLQSLSMYIDCRDDNSEVFQDIADSLGKLYSLRRLDISNLEIHNGKMSFLDELHTPPRLLRSLRIEGVLQRLPPWVELLTYLVEFRIMRARLVDDQLFSVLYKLPNLKSIWMERRCYDSNEIVARSNYNFPVLSNLWVTCDETSLPKIFRFEEGSMTKLEILKMNFTEVERSIFGIEHLPNLKEVELTGHKDNPSLNQALGQLRDENMRRSKSDSQFQIVVKYI